MFEAFCGRKMAKPLPLVDRFLLSLSPTTDGFTPDLKTNEEQKQACCCVDYFLLTSISLFKKNF